MGYLSKPPLSGGKFYQQGRDIFPHTRDINGSGVGTKMGGVVGTKTDHDIIKIKIIKNR